MFLCLGKMVLKLQKFGKFQQHVDLTLIMPLYLPPGTKMKMEPSSYVFMTDQII